MRQSKSVLAAAIILTSIGLHGCGGESESPTPFNFNQVDIAESASLYIGDTYQINLSDVPDSELSNISVSSISGVYTKVDNLSVTGLRAGTDIIRVTHLPTGSYQDITVSISSPNLTQLTLSANTLSRPAGLPIYVNVTGTTENGTLDSEDAKATQWSGGLEAEWDDGNERFTLSSFTPGSYEVSATLGGITESLSITISDAIVQQIGWGADDTGEPHSIEPFANSEQNQMVSAFYSDNTIETNPAFINCESADPLIADIYNPPTEDGFNVKAYAEGVTTFTCSTSVAGGAQPIQMTVSVDAQLTTSWSKDDNNSSVQICPDNDCTIQHIHKSENGSPYLLVESTGDSFWILSTQDFGGLIRKRADVSTPSEALYKSVTGNSNQLSYSNGSFGMFNFAYDTYSSEAQTTISTSAPYTFYGSPSNSSASASAYSPPAPNNALVTSTAKITMGGGIYSAAIFDSNGGELAHSEDDGIYTPEYNTRSRWNSTTLSQEEGRKNDFITRINTVSDSSFDVSEQERSYFKLSSDKRIITQTFITDLPTFGTTRTIDLTACSPTKEENVFVRQVTYPSSATVVLCLGANSIHYYEYADTTSNSNQRTYYTIDNPENWKLPMNLEGLSYMALDTKSDIYGAQGAISMITYLGYSGAESEAVKTHYAVTLQNGELKGHLAKSTIGIDGEPFVSDSILESAPKGILFNYVATSTTDELWTPYGIFGSRNDMPAFSMMIGKAPFKRGSAFPFTYQFEGKKALGLLTDFSSLGSDERGYNSYRINVYYSDLWSL